MSLLGSKQEVAAELRWRRLQRRGFVLGLGLGASVVVVAQVGFGVLYDQAQWRPQWVQQDEYQRGHDAAIQHGFTHDDCEPLSEVIFGQSWHEPGTRQDQVAFVYGCFDGADPGPGISFEPSYD